MIGFLRNLSYGTKSLPRCFTCSCTLSDTIRWEASPAQLKLDALATAELTSIRFTLLLGKNSSSWKISPLAASWQLLCSWRPCFVVQPIASSIRLFIIASGFADPLHMISCRKLSSHHLSLGKFHRSQHLGSFFAPGALASSFNPLPRASDCSLLLLDLQTHCI